MHRHRRLWLIAGPLAAIAAWLACAQLGTAAAATAAVTAWCAVWWITEPVPIPATSLLPFVALPLANVLDHKQVATAYGHSLILLLMGGFMLSAAMEASGAHRRVALGVVSLVGGGGRRLIGGFMLATAALSMWISNTATTLMLLPVAIAVLDQDPQRARMERRLLLGIAWAASIGGMGTPVGTPPNVIFLGVYREVTGHAPDFLGWMALALPVVGVLLPVAWLLICRGLPWTRVQAPALPNPGAWRPAEARVLAVFALTALAWVTRSAPLGGWAGLLGTPGVGDSTVALAAVFLLFLVPNGAKGTLLDWDRAKQIPWDLLLLFGGGIAIARGFGASGLSDALGHWLAIDLGVTHWPTFAMTLTVALVVTFLTEITSNTATTTLLMPVLAAAGVAAGVDPALLMVPAALSASCAFMLPVATAPNAIVYGTGRLSVADMARQGIILNVLGAVVIAAYFALR